MLSPYFVLMARRGWITMISSKKKEVIDHAGKQRDTQVEK
jgi:hypothetical protein